MPESHAPTRRQRRLPFAGAAAAVAFVGALLGTAAAAQSSERDSAFVNLSGIIAPPAAPQKTRPANPNPDVAKLLAHPADLWDRIRNGYAMPDLVDPLVQENERWYVARPELLRALVARARKYLHYIVEAIEQRDMPLELALVPMVESGFNPMALSSAEASGLWQFVPATGKRFDLRQDGTIDERRDVLASTAAALDYFGHLQAEFNDWHLSLAAYNWGENALAAAVARAKAAKHGTRFDALALPAETRNYVPRLQALKNIIAKPEAFGIVLEEIPNEPFFVTLPPVKNLDIATAAKLAEMTPDAFRALNPSFNGAATQKHAALAIVLPVDRVETFKANLARREARRAPKKAR